MKRHARIASVFVAVAAAISAAADESAPVFREFDVRKEFADNPFTVFTGRGMLLCAGDREKSNAMTIGWGALGTLWGRNDAVTVYVAESRYTKKFLDGATHFTVMELDKEKQADILVYMGRNSGRNGDKAAALGLHTAWTENGTPYYEEAQAVYECELMYSAPFDPAGMKDVPKTLYANFPAGVHTMYVGRIVRAFRRDAAAPSAAPTAVPAAAPLPLVQEWDKVFPKSDTVEHSKATFRNRYGITLAADVYKPKSAEGRLPALAVSGPFGAVKEQVSGLYAMRLAERGFHARSVGSNLGWRSTGCQSFLNQPLLAYANEIGTPVLLVHGEKAHSRYFSEGAFEKMTGQKPVFAPGEYSCKVGNKELLLVPGAVHTALYDERAGVIPWDRIDAFLKESLK